MSQNDFLQLLQSGEGLTEQFKSSAASLFQQAVQTKTKQIKQQLQKQKQVYIQNYKQQVVDCADTYVTKFLQQQTDCLKKQLAQQYQNKYLQLVNKLQQQTQFNAELKQQHTKQLNKLNEDIQDIAAERTSEQALKLSETVQRYIDYVAEQCVQEAKQVVANIAKTQFNNDLIQGVKAVFEQYHLQTPTANQLYNQKIAQFESNLQTAYQTIVKLTEQKQAAQTLVQNLKREQALKQVGKDLTLVQMEQLKQMMKDSGNIELKLYTRRARYLAESISSKRQQESNDQQNNNLVQGLNIKDQRIPLTETYKQPDQDQGKYIDPAVKYFASRM